MRTRLTQLTRWIGRRPLRTGLAVLVLVIVGVTLWSAYHTYQAVQALQATQWQTAQAHARLAAPWPRLLEKLTFGRSASLQLWSGSLGLIETGPEVLTSLPLDGSLNQSLWERISLREIASHSQGFFTHLAVVDQALPRAWIVTRLAPETQHDLQLAIHSGRIAQQLLAQYSIGTHQVLVLLQNSDELRPTGGFMGSYALISLDQGRITALTIEDIYDADGQFTGFVAPPPGVAEYLSGDRGLRLPDANWDPDFAVSAQTILPFFALGKRHDIDTVIAVNVETIEHVLGVTGELWLPDYQTSVTADNLSQVLRARRQSFFPGSRQKKLLIEQTAKELQFKVADLNSAQLLSLVSHLQADLAAKNIQVYSVDPQLQDIWVTAGLAGELRWDHQQPLFWGDTATCDCPEPLPFLGLIEANVGINKANRGITRAAILSPTESGSLTLEMTYTNTNIPLTPTELSGLTDALATGSAAQANHNAYVNYARLIVPTGFELNGVQFDGQPMTKIDRLTPTTSAGVSYQSYGFLVVVPEQSQKKLVITGRWVGVTGDGAAVGATGTNQTANSTMTRSATPRQLLLIKQAGIPPTLWQITVGGQTKPVLVERNTVVGW